MTIAQQMELIPTSTTKRSTGWFVNGLSVLGVNEIGGWPDAFGDALCRYNATRASNPITAISLFSGAGGLDIGFHDAGFKIIECNEIEPDFAATLRKNAAEGQRLEGVSIVCEDIHHYIPGITHVDFVLGGPPCQTFSAAGARAAGVNGIDDERGNLFLQYARIIEELKPTGFLFENVYRIVGAQSGKAWKQIQSVFQDIGYRLHWRILDAADYGVPQFRERLIIVGLKTGYYHFPFPSHGPDSPDTHNYYTARQAVSGIDTDHCKIGIGGRHGHLLNDIPPGLNYSFYTERMRHPTPIFGWRSKFSDYLYKADPDTPVRTIKAQGGQYTGPFSWENRPFTIEELKRLQTFPSNYSIEGNRQKIIHQLGNSVPPQLARILALSVLEQVFNVHLPFPIAYMPDSYQLGFRSRKPKLTSVYAKKAEYALLKLAKQPAPYASDITGAEYLLITPDLRIMSNVSSEESEYVAEYSLKPDQWTIYLSQGSLLPTHECYSIQITPPPVTSSSVGSNIPFVKLVSRSCNPKSLLALWKVYELLVQRYLSKDDLVQLFGYYQYKMAFSLSLVLIDQSLMASSFWRVVQSVTGGYGVGVISAISEIASLYDLSDAELFSTLSEMKNLGYEIRSHRTNRQIPDGMILIPYSFPSLNERSLQRLTRL